MFNGIRYSLCFLEIKRRKIEFNMVIEQLSERISKEDLYEFYLIQNHTYPEVMQKFNITLRWQLKELLKFYKFPKKASLDTNCSQHKVQKHTDNNLQNRSSKEVFKNHFCRTLSEQCMYDFLIQKYPDTQYDIRVDGRYPYYCDFYIPSEDLFIELQAHPSHGRLPFDRLDYEEYSKYPVKWINVFAKRDVEKAEYARNHNINLIRIYPSATLQENLEINNTFDTEFIHSLYKTQNN